MLKPANDYTTIVYIQMIPLHPEIGIPTQYVLWVHWRTFHSVLSPYETAETRQFRYMYCDLRIATIYRSNLKFSALLVYGPV